jgi:hypothetical protein
MGIDKIEEQNRFPTAYNRAKNLNSVSVQVYGG